MKNSIDSTTTITTGTTTRFGEMLENKLQSKNQSKNDNIMEKQNIKKVDPELTL